MKRSNGNASSNRPIWAAASLAGLITALIASGCVPTVSTDPPSSGGAVVQEDTTPSTGELAEPETAASGLPRLLDLGAGKCIPCKMMAPVLDELAEQYSDVFEVEFVDVWRNPEEAKKYGVETIPTQIFFDASGNERFRHVGFFSREEILGKWQELGR